MARAVSASRQSDCSRIAAKRQGHPAEKQGKLGGLDADIGVDLVQNYIFEQPPALLQDRRVLAAHEQVFEHGQIGDEERRRARAERLTVEHLLRSSSPLGLG